MPPVRIAVIGAGLIGVRHARIAAAEPTVELAAIVDPAPSAGALAQELGCPWYRDVAEMLASARPDGAIVGVPNTLHVPVGKACAEAGVHMIVEKPVAETVEAGLDLVAAAERAGVHMLVGHHRRYDPAVEGARAIIAGGEIGRVVAVSAVWGARKPDAYWSVAWRREAGGGPILINLIHDIDCLRHMVGEIVEVQAVTSSAVRGFPVEDTAAILLRFAGGALGTVTLSDAAPSPWNWEAASNDNPGISPSWQDCYQVMGTDGALAFPNLAVWRHASAQGPGGWELPLLKEPRRIGPRMALAAQMRHFAAVIRGEETPRITGRDGLATLAATMAVHEAARTRAPVVPASVG